MYWLEIRGSVASVNSTDPRGPRGTRPAGKRADRKTSTQPPGTVPLAFTKPLLHVYPLPRVHLGSAIIPISPTDRGPQSGGTQTGKACAPVSRAAVADPFLSCLFPSHPDGGVATAPSCPVSAHTSLSEVSMRQRHRVTGLQGHGCLAKAL